MAAIWSQIKMLIAPKRSRTARQKAKLDLLNPSWVLGKCRGEIFSEGKTQVMPSYPVQWFRAQNQK